MNLKDKIDSLKEEITFLREDSLNKSTMINNLLAITRQSMANEIESSDGDVYNNGFDEYRKKRFYSFPRFDEGPEGDDDIVKFNYFSDGDNNDSNLYENDANEIYASKEWEDESVDDSSKTSSSSSIPMFNSTPVTLISQKGESDVQHTTQYEWQRFSNGVASKIMAKIYRDKGEK